MNDMVTIIDATGCVLGRMCTRVAKRLLQGETVHVVNAEKALVSGTTKSSIKERYSFKYHVGTYRKGPFMSRMPHQIVKRTVRGMIPYQTPTGREALKRLKAHIGVPAELKGQETIAIEAAKREPSGTTMTVGEISEYLGVQSNVPEGA